MWTSTTLAGAAVAMTALLTTGVGTPAGADPTPQEPTRVALADGTGDVWVIGPGEDDWDPFGERATIDTVGGTVRHRAHAVTASLTFLDLRRVQSKDFDVRMRTGAGTYRAIVSTDAEHPFGRHRLIDRSESRVPCPGLTHDIDYAADTVRVMMAEIGLALVAVSVRASSSSTQENMKQKKAATPMPLANSGMKIFTKKRGKE